ncbi:MAG: hypothetical protein MRY72_10885 [Aquisalinus sp.]|nr:hypothetical protein [Aquisalinus sp.]
MPSLMTHFAELRRLINTFSESESGATFMEYTMIIALLSIATLAFFGQAVDTMSDLLSDISSEVDGAVP